MLHCCVSLVRVCFSINAFNCCVYLCCINNVLSVGTVYLCKCCLHSVYVRHCLSLCVALMLCTCYLGITVLLIAPITNAHSLCLQGIKPENKVAADGRRVEDYWPVAKKVNQFLSFSNC